MAPIQQYGLHHTCTDAATHCVFPGMGEEPPRPTKKLRGESSLPSPSSATAPQAPPSAPPAPCSAPESTLGLQSLPAADSPLDALPDDVLTIILAHAATGSRTPGDFINLLLTSRRVCHMGGQAAVLRRLPAPALQASAASWCPAAQRFLSRCSQAGNSFASYALGMIGFYCLDRPQWGLRLLTQAALAGNPDALYSLAIVHFNGSGRGKEHREVASAVLLCTQAAMLGHVDATRELGHCLQDGYGVVRDPQRGRSLLLRANIKEASEALGAVGGHKAHAALPAVGQDEECCHGHQCCAGDSHGDAEEDRPRASPFSQWRKRALPRADVMPLSRTFSAPAVLPSQMETHFRLFGSEEASSPRGTAPSGPAVLATTEGDECPYAHATPSTDPLLGHMPHQQEGARPSPWVSHASREAEEHGHQCCCLPAVTLPLHARSGGWVRLFMLDWHYLVDLGLIQSASLVECEQALGGDPEEERMQCSNRFCGRRELRDSEFRCCSACTEARYCSRACQAQDWKLGHKRVCSQIVQLQMMQEVAGMEEDGQ